MTSEVESCGPESSFTYGPMIMESTLFTEFDMVCDKSKEVCGMIFRRIKAHAWIIQVWVPLSSSFFMLGIALGSLGFGLLSDEIGRRHALLTAILTARW